MIPARSAPALEGFREALVAELCELDGYLELLEAEQRAIQEGLIQPLEQLQPEKSVRLQALREHRSRRAAFLSQNGYRAGSAGLSDLLAANPGLESSVGRAWQALCTKAWEASHLTRLNAALAATHLDHFRARLEALVGSAPGATQTYGVNGALAAFRLGPRWHTAG